MTDIIGGKPGAYGTGDACPVRQSCKNYSGACWRCVVPEGGRGPTEYVPTSRTAPKHPATIAYLEGRQLERRAKKDSPESRRGRASKRKGYRREKEFADLTGGERVPLSGALGGRNLSNDVHLPPSLGSLQVEVKARATGFRQLYGWIEDTREHPDLLALKADNKPWLIVMTLDRWMQLTGEVLDA